ncbi:hypothetical protein [Caudoviricetes sp.]|nr:hypothetical protein [Caudoviricetes sp.]
MPILEIGGKRVEVDPSFLDLSPEDQQLTVNEIHSSFAAPAPKTGSHEADLAARAAVRGGIGMVAGLPATVRDAAMFIPNQIGAGLNTLAEQANKNFGTNIPLYQAPKSSSQTVQEMGQQAANALGLAQPQTPQEESAVNLAAGGLEAIGPGGWGRALAKAPQLPGMVRAIGSSLGSTGKALDFTSGVAGEAARQYVENREEPNPVEQMSASFLGGMIPYLVSPAAMAGGGAIRAAGAKVANKFVPSEAVVKEAAASDLASRAKTAGEDLSQSLNNLQDASRVGTPAERAASPTFVGMQDILARDNPEFARKVEATRQSAAEGLAQEAKQAASIGDPNALALAAKAEEARVNTGLQGAKNEAAAATETATRDITENFQKLSSNVDAYIEAQSGRAKEAASKFTAESPEARRVANTQAYEVANKADKVLTSIENNVWKKADLNQPGSPVNFLATEAKLRENMLEAEKFPPVIEGEIKKYKDAIGQGEPQMVPSKIMDQYGKPVMVPAEVPTNEIKLKDLQNLRSKVLAEARSVSSGATPDYYMAERLRQLGGALLEDLGSSNDPTIRAAQNFSRELHDKFSRSYAGDILNLKPTGGAAVLPELALEKAGSGQRMAANFRQLQEATAPIPYGTNTEGAVQPQLQGIAAEIAAKSKEGLAGLPEQMQAAQEQFLRLNAEKLINPRTGMLDATRVSNFIRDNRETLSRFPGLQAQLEKGAAAQSAAVEAAARGKQDIAGAKSVAEREIRAQEAAGKQTTAEIGRVEKIVNDQSAFAKVIKAGERPEIVVSKAIEGNNPIGDIGKLSKLARSAGPEAMAGLRSSVMDYLFNQAASGEAISFTKMKGALDSPIAQNKAAFVKVLRDEGIITAGQQVSLNKIIQRGVEMEKAAANPAAIKSIAPELGDGLSAILAKAAGSKYFKDISLLKNMLGPLQAPALGSKFGMKIFEQMPANRIKDTFIRALDDPELMKDLMARATSQKVQTKIDLNLKNSLLKNGLISVQDVEGMQ